MSPSRDHRGQQDSGCSQATLDWLQRASISPEVMQLQPDYSAVIVVAEGLTPGSPDDDSDALLRDAEEFAQATLAGQEPHELKQVAAWRDAFRAFGAKPQRTRPSVEALLRRASAGLPRIDRLTDVYNAISVRHLIPVGGEDLDQYHGPASLVRAIGDEPFDTTSDGQPVTDHPAPGEVVWRDDSGVTCRCWNWRQCTRTRITGATVNGMFILDGLAVLGADGLTTAATALTSHLETFNPGAHITWRHLRRTPGN
jgi:DNA/RNA-binding domain of Phe-tRNA-synthetase-like protein